MSMDAIDFYQRLMGHGDTPAPVGDRHVIAAILALALAEQAAENAPPLDRLGLAGDALCDLVAPLFPDALPLFVPWRPLPAPRRGDDEACLFDLLWRTSSERTPFQGHLAALVARRAQRPNHLWQDLGLRDRGELSWLMHRHFTPLARRNIQDMKWKKFLYRTICRDEGYGFCTAPSCGECDDFERCFGDESGDSLLARTRRAVEARV